MLKIPQGGSMVLLRSVGFALDRQDAARRLATLAGVPFYDAMNVIGHHHGRILAEDLDPEVARQWAEALHQQGAPAEVLHAPDIVRPDRQPPALRVAYDASGLQVWTERDQSTMAWGDLQVIAVGNVLAKREAPHLEQERRREQQSLLGALMGGPQDLPPALSMKLPEKMLVVELYSATGRVTVLQARGMTYTHLGSRMQPSSTENIRITVREMAGYAPGASRTEAVERFLGGSLLHDIQYEDVEAFHEEATWLLQARTQGWLPGGQVRPTNRFDALEL